MENINKNQGDSHFLKKISLVSILISIVGFAVSLYALIIHLELILNSSSTSVCDINAKLSCSAVIGSSYGEFAAIPLGAFGMTYFSILFSAAIMPRIANINHKWLASVELALGLVGLFTSIVLAYISYKVIQITCPTCTVIHITTAAYTLVKIKQYLNLKNETKRSQPDALTRFLAVSLCFGLPPLAAGLIGNIMAEHFKKPAVEASANTEKKPEQSNIPTVEANNATKALMTFNKTNFVGNGEDYRRGSDSAKVIVQMFSDYGCPHCRIATEAIMKAQDIVGLNKVLYVYRFFPLSNKCNPFMQSEGPYEYSCTLTEATRCAGQQGKFWEFKSWGFSAQFWSDAQRSESFSMKGLKKEADVLGINSDQFTQCIQSHVELQKIKDDAQIANQLNIKGTPLIFINGVEYTGDHTFLAFSEAFNRSL
ncbi:vitamin K epoxide reductase family protein [Fluviispira sanaruensis]|uniref:Vitamin K epoxide reductase n=1 Tax=Fluviispira sanaruensis TaxID=2493639 RepID=A0A4V0P2L4_FLUSA|nr:vitamin K epoxide reductase family protein [Fluviispira sanaruensis]BBH53637.1 vitamin K epoxide reductase [Fluviispira sanaruensis]